MTKAKSKVNQTLLEIYNYLTKVHGWEQLRITDSEFFIGGENMSFKFEGDCLTVSIDQSKIQRYKGTAKDIANRVDTFLDGYFFFV